MSFTSFVSYLRNPQLKRTCIFNIVSCTVLLCVVPYIIGWVGGSVLGALFAPVLAQHSTLFWLTQYGLRTFGTLVLVGGIDFSFLFMVYIAINTVFECGNSKKDIARVTFRAFKGVLCWQVIMFATFLVFFGQHSTVDIYSLVPPFLTQSRAASWYMMFWELSIILFALGYALMEDGIKACLAGGMLGFTNFMVLFVASGACIIITWLPGLCLNFLHVPTWVLVLIGVTLHTVFFSGLLYVLLHQDNIQGLFMNAQ